METMRLLRAEFPEILLCVSSNGLGIMPYIPELARIGVSHVTITVSTLDAATGAKIYRWVRDNKKVKRGLDGAELMIDRQLAAIRQLKAHGIVVKVNSILIPGINDSGSGGIQKVAEMCQAKGADLHNIIPLCPVEGTDFESITEPSSKSVDSLRAICGEMVTQMTHCQRCRADACGKLCEGTSENTMRLLNRISSGPAHPGQKRDRIAVASREGMLVNLHLGEASEFYIFDYIDGSAVLHETRKAPPSGSGALRWEELAHTLKDCSVILAASAGPSPCKLLLKKGLKVTIMEGLISEAVDAIKNGRKIKAPVRTFKCGAGVTCGGDGQGC
jgi:nitrogen fixation protein NifB